MMDYALVYRLKSHCQYTPFLIRPGLRRATFPPGEGI